jgi:hypothetical protein
MLKLLSRLVPVLASLALLPTTVSGQTRLAPFVEAGALVESSSNLGGHAELGLSLSPVWRVGVSTEAANGRYNDYSWSTYSLVVGGVHALTDRVGLDVSGGFGRFRSTEFGVRDSVPSATIGVAVPIAVSRHVAIVPQLRGLITFEGEGPGDVSTLGIAFRWRR